MSQKSLNFKISIEGDETILRDLQSKLGVQGDLSDQLCTAILQTLNDVGLNDNLSAVLQCGQIKNRYGQGGGLSAMEWIERKEVE